MKLLQYRFPFFAGFTQVKFVKLRFVKKTQNRRRMIRCMALAFAELVIEVEYVEKIDVNRLIPLVMR